MKQGRIRGRNYGGKKEAEIKCPNLETKPEIRGPN